LPRGIDDRVYRPAAARAPHRFSAAVTADTLAPADTCCQERRPAVVPKILHRIRLGKDVLPPEAAYYELLWKQLHPTWEHITWTMNNLPPMVNAELFHSSSNLGHRADVLRLEVIHRFGGVYVDLDMVAQRPLDPLLECEAFLGQIPPTPTETCVQRVETAIMGSATGNPFVGLLIQNLPRWAADHPKNSVAARTGPQYVQNQIDRWKGPGPLPLMLHPPSYFYPYMWHERQRASEPFPGAYAIHRWWGTWWRQKEPAPGHP
jgi:mannosyltransferase OCH1-like enzyme